MTFYLSIKTKGSDLGQGHCDLGILLQDLTGAASGACPTSSCTGIFTAQVAGSTETTPRHS